MDHKVRHHRSQVDERQYVSGRAYCRALGDRLEVLIRQAEDPSSAMDEIAKAAARGGLILDDAIPRRDTPSHFVLDLLTENPVAGDWMNCRLDSMKPIYDYEGIYDVAEHLL